MRAIVSVALVTIQCGSVFAGTIFPSNRTLAQCRLDMWTVRDGLPNRDIKCIAQTTDGFLWLGTDAGLIRFDGASFDRFDFSNTPGLTSNSVTALAADPDGSLWVGTERGGVGHLSQGRYTKMIDLGTGWNAAMAFHFAPDGSLWVGCWSSISVYRIAKGKVVPYPGVPHAVLGVADDVMPDQTATVDCLESDGTIVRVDPNRPSTSPVVLAHAPVNATCLAETPDHKLWCGTLNSGLIAIDGRTHRAVKVSGCAAVDAVKCLIVDKGGILWAGTRSGIVEFANGAFNLTTQTGGLYRSYVGSIYEDCEGNIWAGVGTSLSRFAATKVVPYTPVAGADAANLPVSDGLAVDPNGGTFCVTDIGVWHMRDGALSACRFTGAKPALHGGIAVVSPTSLWLWQGSGTGTDFQHCRIDERNGESVTLTVDAPVVHSKADAICAVANGDGLTVFGNNQSYNVTVHGAGAAHVTGTGWLFCAEADGHGGAWVGCEHGLAHVMKSKCRLEDAGLPAGTHVLGISPSVDGSLWLATDSGLAHFDGGRSKRIAGLPDTNLFEVSQDRSGDVWVGCHAGIVHVAAGAIAAYENRRISRVPYMLYTLDDGIRAELVAFSAVRAVDGTLWFAGLNSVAMVDPGAIPHNAQAPPVAIESASLDMSTLTPAVRNIVSPGDGKLDVRFAALSFVAPERLVYRYRLDGFDTRETVVKNQRRVSYTNLPPGKYRFHVSACNDDGVCNDTGASIAFELQPHYYQTAWFKIVCVMLGLLLGWLYVRLRTFELKRQVARRTEELSLSNEQLMMAQGELSTANEELSVRNEELETMQMEIEAQHTEILRTQEILAEANLRLESLAATDGLTGLTNHRAFQEHLDTEWRRRDRHHNPLSVILLDVDHFKQFNDTFGHPAGDAVLRNVADVLREYARAVDVVARYGGEEFVVIAPDTDRDGATALAERLRAAIEAQPWPLRQVTASIGVSTTTMSTTSASELIVEADQSLYRSKKQGRNRVTHHAVDEDDLSSTVAIDNAA